MNPNKNNTWFINRDNFKGDFFLESEIRFSNIQIFKKNTPIH